MGFRFSLDEKFGGDYVAAGVPPVGKENGYIPTLQPFVERHEGGVVPLSALPVNELAGIAATGFPYPNPVFFEPRKCRISSSSTVTDFDNGAGFS